MSSLNNHLKRAEFNAKQRDQQSSINLDSVNLENQKATEQGYGLFKLKKPNKAVFTQTINDNLEILLDQQYLTNSELGLIFSLMPFIELHSNAIVNDKNQFMTVSEMAIKLKRERTRTSKTITQLVKKGVLFEFVNAQEIREFKTVYPKDLFL